MRKRLLTFAFICASTLLLSIALHAQESDPIAGHWEGAYVRQGAIQTVMLDLKQENGRLTGTFDVPERGLFDEPLTEIEYSFPQLVARLNYGVFTMQLSPAIGELTGENKSWGPPVAIHLKRKPKSPRPAYPRQEVQFKNGEVTLSGTLIKPLTAAPHPAVVIIHGSDGGARTEGYYRFWGDFFAARGMAVLLYDKRGTGASGGNLEKAGFDNLASDAVKAAELLAGRKDIDRKRIGLFGISQGGWLAPLAATRTRAVAFLILNVGPAVTVAEQELHRVEYTMRGEDFTEEEIQAALAYTRRVFDAAYTGEGRAELEALTASVREKRWAEQVQLVKDEKDLLDWRQSRYDPAPVLKQVRVPVLSLFGERDVLVPPRENQPKMERYLREAGNRDVTIRVIPGVGHGMESYGTLKGGEWKWPEKFWVWPKKSQLFYQTIHDWLQAQRLIKLAISN